MESGIGRRHGLLSSEPRSGTDTGGNEAFQISLSCLGSGNDEDRHCASCARQGMTVELHTRTFQGSPEEFDCLGIEGGLREEWSYRH